MRAAKLQKTERGRGGWLVLALALGLAACSPIDEGAPEAATDGQSADETEPEGEESDEVTPAAGGVLQVGRVADMVSVDGHVTGAANHTMTDNIFGRLISYEPGFEPVGMLAETFEVNADATEFTVRLREGLTFHNGTPITSETIASNIERVAAPETGADQIQGIAAAVVSVDTPDELTAIVAFEQSTLVAQDLFNYMAIVDPDNPTGLDGEAGLVTNGSGPFKLVEWAPGERIVLERFEDYWDADQVLLDGVEFRILGDPDAMLLELQAGTIDVAESVRPEDAARLRDQGYEAVINDANMYFMMANLANAPMNDVRVRQAINYALDRDRFIEQSLGGLVERTALVWPPSSPAFDESDGSEYQFDLQRAQELLEEAGVADGLEIELITNAAQAPLADMATILQSDLASIGVDVTIRDLAPPEWRPLAFEAAYQDLIAGPATVDYLPASVFSFTLPLTPDRNQSNLASQPELHQEYEQLVDAAVTAPDQDALDQALAEIRSFLLEQSFVIPIAPNPNSASHGESVSGLGYRIGTGGLNFSRASISG